MDESPGPGHDLGMRTPDDALRAQALHCRWAWTALGPGGRDALAERLKNGDDWDLAWVEVLAGEHPLARWLEGDAPYEALPRSFPAGPNARQLLSSHPFTGWHPWSILPSSPGSSSTPPG